MTTNPVDGNPFLVDGPWYRGNLHMHSTNSDGLKSPADAVAWYRDAGYDFVALSDHRVVSDTTAYAQPGFVTIPGIEMHGPDPYTGERYHILATGVSGFERSDDSWGPQEAIDRVNAGGGLAVMAHPYWLGQSANDMLEIEGFVGMEVFNSVCDVTRAKGVSGVTWDEYLLQAGLTWGFATDDSHWKHGAEGRGWVMVRTQDFTPAGLVAALRRGHFYSSMGPEILDLRVEDGAVRVRTSPAARISFIAARARGSSQRAGSEPLTAAAHELRGEEIYVRVEVQDTAGRIAWSNPILV